MTRRSNPGLGIKNFTYDAHGEMSRPDAFLHAYPDADEQAVREWKENNPDAAIEFPKYQSMIATLIRQNGIGTSRDLPFNPTKLKNAAEQLATYWVQQKFPVDFRIYVSTDMTTQVNRLLRAVCVREIFLTWLDRDWRLRLGWNQLLYSREWMESLRLSKVDRDRVVRPYVIEETMTEWVLEEWSEEEQPSLPAGIQVPDEIWSVTVGEVYEAARKNRELTRAFGRTLKHAVHFVTRENAIVSLVPTALMTMDALLRKPQQQKGGGGQQKYEPLKNMERDYQ